MYLYSKWKAKHRFPEATQLIRTIHFNRYAYIKTHKTYTPADMRNFMRVDVLAFYTVASLACTQDHFCSFNGLYSRKSLSLTEYNSTPSPQLHSKTLFIIYTFDRSKLTFRQAKK